MILNGKDLTYRPFSDSRGKSGMSGKLSIAEAQDGMEYLVKPNPVDVANEFAAHRIAKMIGVPTSDAVLIRSGNTISVGIVFEPDFQRVSMDEFVGTEKAEDDDEPLYFDGSKGVWVGRNLSAGKYPNDDPFMAELMAYLAFRSLIVLQDHVQLAFSGGHLISFDYAESFYLTDVTFDGLLRGRGLSHAVSLFGEHLKLASGYRNAIEVLHRPNTDFLLDAFLDPVFAFQDADFQPILDDLNAVFPATVSAFYSACFELVKREIGKLGE